MSIDHIISEIYNLRIKDVILIGDDTILLYYRYRFMGSPHIVDSRLQSRVLLLCYLYKVLECS